MKIKALSVRQPWASWIAEGYKTIETRMWGTKYRGPILICASKRPDPNPKLKHLVKNLPKGVAVAVAELVDCRQMVEDDSVPAMCPVYPRAVAWILRKIRPIEPFPVKGQVKLFDVEVSQKMLEPSKKKRRRFRIRQAIR